MSSPRPELRIGDRERDQVTSVLQNALAEGRITLEELDQRLDSTLRARTFADLDVLVADLPVDPPSTAVSAPDPAGNPLAGAPGSSPQDRLVLDAGWSSVTRRGRWDLPPFLRLNGSAGSVRLNCLQATAATPVVDVEVDGGMGRIVIVLPDSWAANTDRLSSMWGMTSIKVPARPGPGAPLLRLHGSVGWGWLTVRPASYFDRRRLRREALARPVRRRLGP